MKKLTLALILAEKRCYCVSKTMTATAPEATTGFLMSLNPNRCAATCIYSYGPGRPESPHTH